MMKVRFASATDPSLLSKGTFVLMESNEGLEIMILHGQKACSCGIGIRLWGDDEMNDISPLIGKYPYRVNDMPELTKYPIYEMELERVPIIINRKVKKYLSSIAEYLTCELTEETLKRLQENVTALATTTNMNRDLYIKISDLYEKIVNAPTDDDIFLYKNTVRVFINEFVCS